MSLDLMNRVWRMEIPSTPKIVLLSLADQANEAGVCWPSQPQIASRCSLTDRAVRDQLAWLEKAKAIHRETRSGIGTTFTLTLSGFDEPRNHVPPRNDIPPRNHVPATPEQYSGNPGTTFRQIISKRKESPVEGDKPPVSSKAADPSFPSSVEKRTAKSRLKELVTLQTFLEACREEGSDAIPQNDPIFDYADKVGISTDMLHAAWSEFKARFQPTPQKQKDWRAHFRKAVRSNWYKLWYVRDGELAQWTTAGEQARRAAA